MPAQITAAAFAERERHYVYCNECEWRSDSLSPYSNGYPHELSKLEDDHNTRFHDPDNPPRFVPGAMYQFTAESGEMDWAWAMLNDADELALVVIDLNAPNREITLAETETAVPA